jgi:hypothetical protein
MSVREATLWDTKILADVERMFCLPRNIPPEVQAGALWFLQNGGSVYLYELDGTIHSAIWLISIGALRDSPTTGLPLNSPIRAVHSYFSVQPAIADDLLAYSWTPVAEQSKWLYRWILRFLQRSNDTVYGFVSCSDEIAVRNYLRMGCKIVGSIPDLYGDKNAHFVLLYQSNMVAFPLVSDISVSFNIAMG